jgi:hypothetical protein
MYIVAPVETSPGGSSTDTITFTMPGPGVIFVHTDGQSPPANSVASNVNGAFTEIQFASNPFSSGLYPGIWKLDGAAGATHTISLSAPAATMYYNFAVGVVGGQYDGSNQNGNNFLGTGSDVNASGSITTSGADIVFAFFAAFSGGALPTVGTSPIAFTNIALPLGAPNKNLLEYYAQSGPGAINPTAGSTVNGGVQGFTFAASPISGILLPGRPKFILP